MLGSKTLSQQPWGGKKKEGGKEKGHPGRGEKAPLHELLSSTTLPERGGKEKEGKKKLVGEKKEKRKRPVDLLCTYYSNNFRGKGKKRGGKKKKLKKGEGRHDPRPTNNFSF